MSSLEIKALLGSWEYLLVGSFSDSHFVLQESTTPLTKQFAVQETCLQEFVWKSGPFDYNALQNVPPKDLSS